MIGLRDINDTSYGYIWCKLLLKKPRYIISDSKVNLQMFSKPYALPPPLGTTLEAFVLVTVLVRPVSRCL